MLSEHRFTDQSALLQALREFFVAHITQGLAQHPEITLLLSGGSTPLPFYRDLGQQALPWERLHLALVDERWVAPTQAASNERALREALGPQAAARFTGMYAASSLLAALPQVNHRYARLPRPWTLGLLGLGPDGHTASLFPAALGLGQALSTFDLCAALSANASAAADGNTERMTLSLSALLGINHLVLLFTGAAKWRVYEQALVTQQKDALPVSYLLQQDSVPLDVFWCP
ncbi:MAG: 6-phosphogluconolactonase [Pseudomonadales bacterium]|jgi:6-phosphogluconolactonase|nr:6-phosphogluconolactonase [Pseudomonadales bacterium]